jgi:DNA-binding NtrC family response regulator
LVSNSCVYGPIFQSFYGYSDLISAEKATLMGFRDFIMKPFTVREGAELVRRVLDEKSPR